MYGENRTGKVVYKVKSKYSKRDFLKKRKKGGIRKRRDWKPSQEEEGKVLSLMDLEVLSVTLERRLFLLTGASSYAHALQI